MGVAGRQKRASSLVLEEVGELCRSRRLARSLKTHEHDDVRCAVLRKDELGLSGAEQFRELVEHDFHDVLGGRERVEDLDGHAAFLAAAHEALHDTVVDVRLEQRHANLAHGLADVILAETSLAPQRVKGRLEPVGEAVEHVYPLSFVPTRAAQKSCASKGCRSPTASPTPMRKIGSLRS